MNRSDQSIERLQEHLAFLYGEERSHSLLARLLSLIAHFRASNPMPRRSPSARFSERDAVLITYGDMVIEPGVAPLQSLTEFLVSYVSEFVNTVHLLPFYPYSSDDGFSVIDYQAVDPRLGDWGDISGLGRSFRLMFDAVINHISAQSAWFQGFLQDDPQYRHHFVVVEPDADVSRVFRPRALPLLTPVETVAGPKLVWTTFSADQIDLNYANPNVLLDIIETLLFYVEHGAELIRLDAIGFMWKEPGTSCIHLPQTHRIIQLMRTVLDVVAPHVILITETNVPHEQNIAYFGDGTGEAQMVYNFTLPPLTLHAFQSGNAEQLSAWADTLTLPSEEVTFFNFLASHDGIGLTPLRGILDQAVVTDMADRTEALGGHVSYKSNPDGSQSAYELNINYLDALADPESPDEDLEMVCRRFLATQAAMLAMRGVPGIYFHSLFGSRGWAQGVTETGRFRTINRQKLARGRLEQELATDDTLRQRIFSGYRDLLQRRITNAAFHPGGEQRILFCQESVLAVLRSAPAGDTHILCLHNVSSRPQHVPIDPAVLPLIAERRLVNVFDSRTYQLKPGHRLVLPLAPYGVSWLKLV